MSRLLRIVFIILSFLWGRIVFPCTGFTGSSGDHVLVGNNEDYGYANYRDVVVRIRPADAGTYGCLLYGFSRHNYPMGGMNDRGLFFDMYGLPDKGWFSSPERLNHYPGDKIDLDYGLLEEKMLAECADVEDAISFFHKYNNPGFKQHHIFVVDRAGNSAIIEWGEGDIVVIRKQGDYQVITNFFNAHPEWGGYPCWRYDTAVEMLENAGEFSMDLFRTILDAVHVSVTRYSIIFEPRQGDIYLFFHHYFDEFVKLNIHDELQKGRNDHDMPQYFSEISIISPINETNGDPKNLRFSWYGRSKSKYKLYYSTDPNFTNCEPVDVKVEDGTGMGSVFLYVGVLALIIAFRSTKKPLLPFVISLLLIVVLNTCRRENAPSSGNNNIDSNPIRLITVTINDLQPGSTYYWKITARAFEAEKFTSESIVNTFSTRINRYGAAN